MNTCKTAATLRALAIALALAAVPVAAPAQESSAASNARLKPIYVQLTGSPEIRGRLESLGPDTLALVTDAGPRTIPLTDVVRIDVAGDSVKNGAIIGAIVLGGWCALACRIELTGGEFAAGVLINSGFGALIGAGIDAARSGRTTIYRKDSAPSRRRTIGASFTLGF